MAKVSYRVTNTTVKPKNIDRATRKDSRSAIEVRGYDVQWKDNKGNLVKITPKGKKMSAITSDLHEGLLMFQARGEVKIEEFAGGIAELMREHTLKQEKINVEKEIKTEKEEITTDNKKKANAVIMGEDKHGEDKKGDKTGYPGAVNPDGPDNHTVVAPRRRGNKK